MPFLENVLRGKNVPHERMLQVAEHYRQFGGVSPINAQNRQLINALRAELDRSAIALPIYWGNRNWHPLLPETLNKMFVDGKKRALAFFTSMFSCYSGCRQYRENIAAAQEQLQGHAPQVDKLRMGFNHPGFVDAQAELAREAMNQFAVSEHRGTRLIFTAHSIPLTMSDHSDYVKQLHEAGRLVAEQMGHDQWEIAYQSRSGPPQQPWLEPDICDRLRTLHAEGVQRVVVVPLGFVSDHMEVLFDLDTEAKSICQSLGMGFVRAPSVGTHPAFVGMIRVLIQERLQLSDSRKALGALPASHDVCPQTCCLYPRETRRPTTS